VGKTPEYPTIVPYLILPNASEFLTFTKKVFGAEESLKFMRDTNTIQHAEIKIGDSVIMFADATEEFASQPAGLTVHVINTDEAFKKAIDAGATAVMEPSDQQYGRSAGVKDSFGNTWWLITRK